MQRAEEGVKPEWRQFRHLGRCLSVFTLFLARLSFSAPACAEISSIPWRTEPRPPAPPPQACQSPWWAERSTVCLTIPQRKRESRQRQMRRDILLAQRPGRPRHPSRASCAPPLCSLVISARVSSGQNHTPNPCLYPGIIMATPTRKYLFFSIDLGSTLEKCILCKAFPRA